MGLESEGPAPDQSARQRETTRAHAGLRFELYRRPAAGGKRAMRGIWGVVQRRRLIDEYMRMETPQARHTL